VAAHRDGDRGCLNVNTPLVPRGFGTARPRYHRAVIARWLVVVTACAIACSQQPTQRPKSTHAEPSADRTNPLPLVLEEHAGSESLRVTTVAPTAGTWWYVVAIPERPNTLTTFALEIRGKSGVDGLSVAWLDDRGDERPVATINAALGALELDIPETATPPPRVVIRVTTTERRLIRIAALRTYRAVPEPPSSPPANAQPRCDPNNPDFSNPRCCMPRGCEYGRLTCKAKLVQYDPTKPLTSATISLGAKDEIVTFARGRLYQRVDRHERSVSHVWVRGVSETESLISIESPEAVDPKQLADSWVILSAPDACQRR
jgi:hypothetical protein